MPVVTDSGDDIGDILSVATSLKIGPERVIEFKSDRRLTRIKVEKQIEATLRMEAKL